jgi:hypothetical protein
MISMGGQPPTAGLGGGHTTSRAPLVLFEALWGGVTTLATAVGGRPPTEYLGLV